MEYKKSLLEEIQVCVEYLKFTRGDVMIMPTYERRFYLANKQNQLIDAEESRTTGNKTVKTGKHTRTRTFSPK